MNKTLIPACAMCISGILLGACSKTPTGVDRANLDTSVSPKDDFYEYACGGWMKANPLTDEYSRYGIFNELGELNRKQVLDLVEGLQSQNPAAGTNARKVADLYALGMDSTRLNNEGAAPLATDLATINNASRDQFIEILATMPGVNAFFGTEVEADMRNADINTMYWGQGGLGLGDRDYYLEDSDNAKAVREAYRNFLAKAARLAGYEQDAANTLADNAMRIETALAEAAMTREELRDPLASYNPMTLDSIAQQWPAVDMKRYFALQGVEGIDTLIVGQPGSFQAVNDILANESEQAIRDYIAAGYLSSAADFLSDDFVQAAFELQQVLSGVQEQQPRWKRAVNIPNEMMGEALGELYVAKYFPPESKEKMLKLVANLQEALGQHINNLSWMSDETKAKALEKLSTFKVKIGYPDKWIDYSSLDINPEESYWHNIQEAILFNHKRNLADYGKPVDKDRWYMSPQTVNAYYSPLTNEICFPAGILQKPFFDPDADDAMNYGAIGVVIGHEMTHGFDDQGRQFDKDGNLNDWWTAEDATAFNALADALAAQFDAIEVAPGVHANGRFTLGENIADQGGLRVAHTAYHNSLGNKEGNDIDGFTPDQRFYLAYATVWANNIRPEEILKRTKTDPHSLGRWRVNATLRNIEPFFEAFEISDGDPMFRPENERVVIW